LLFKEDKACQARLASLYITFAAVAVVLALLAFLNGGRFKG